jgi:hypothetical protein
MKIREELFETGLINNQNAILLLKDHEPNLYSDPSVHKEGSAPDPVMVCQAMPQ